MDDVSKLSAIIDKTKTETTQKLRSYFRKRTPEEVQADNAERQRQLDIKNAKEQYAGDVEYYNKSQSASQPSRAEEALVNLGKKVKKGAAIIGKKAISSGKQAVKKANPVVEKAVRDTVAAGVQMGRGISRVEEEEKETRKRNKQ